MEAKKIYKCNNCGAYFDKPVDGGMERDTGAHLNYCPNCGDEGWFSDAYTCIKCGEPVDNYGDFCETCQQEITNSMKEARDSLGMEKNAFYEAVVWWIEDQ